MNLLQDLQYFGGQLRRISYIDQSGMQTPEMYAAPVPRWTVECRSCAATIVHSEVGADRTIVDYLKPTARKFSPLGEELQCPRCNTKHRYGREDLRYQSS